MSEVTFTYIDFDGSQKTVTATVKLMDSGDFVVINLAHLGYGKKAATIDKAIVNLIGGRELTKWSFV